MSHFLEALVMDVRHLVYAEYLTLDDLATLACTSRAYRDELMNRDIGPLYLPPAWRKKVARRYASVNRFDDYALVLFRRVMNQLHRTRFFYNVGGGHMHMKLSLRILPDEPLGFDYAKKFAMVVISCDKTQFAWKVTRTARGHHKENDTFEDAVLTPAILRLFKDKVTVFHAEFLAKQRRRNTKAHKELNAKLRPHRDVLSRAHHSLVEIIRDFKSVRTATDLRANVHRMRTLAREAKAFCDAHDALSAIERDIPSDSSEEEEKSE